MIICPNRYDDGQLLAPRDDEMTKSVGMGGTPTTDTGYCHRFRFCSMSRAEQDAKIARFFNIMGNVPGFSTLQLKPYESNSGVYRHGLDITYTVETPDTEVR